tara:strand:- start:11702 stop:12016 length:315 start_codon:yes stop_codon:yes gene_type:complete
MARRSLISFCAVFIFSHSQADANYTGYELLQACKDISRVACVQYINAIKDTSNYLGKPLCYPASLNSHAFNQSVIKFIEQNPKMLHMNAAKAVIFASHRIYPCK